MAFVTYNPPVYLSFRCLAEFERSQPSMRSRHIDMRTRQLGRKLNRSSLFDMYLPQSKCRQQRTVQIPSYSSGNITIDASSRHGESDQMSSGRPTLGKWTTYVGPILFLGHACPTYPISASLPGHLHFLGGVKLPDLSRVAVVRLGLAGWIQPNQPTVNRLMCNEPLLVRCGELQAPTAYGFTDDTTWTSDQMRRTAEENKRTGGMEFLLKTTALFYLQKKATPRISKPLPFIPKPLRFLPNPPSKSSLFHTLKEHSKSSPDLKKEVEASTSLISRDTLTGERKMEKYELVRDIGSGNFGVARLMRNKETKELVAMKYIERGHKIDENVAREIINHRSLRHPNIIRFKEVILTPTHLAIVMEYAAGGELFERICNAGRFSEDEARYFFQQLISGVSYCHSMQICHRDLKLENTLLDGSPAPRLKICDFGYSKSSLLHSRPKSTVGTPAYIAPEVLSRREYDGKSIFYVLDTPYLDTSAKRPEWGCAMMGLVLTSYASPWKWAGFLTVHFLSRKHSEWNLSDEYLDLTSILVLYVQSQFAPNAWPSLCWVPFQIGRVLLMLNDL
ncbi:hypothetical protein ACLOJK_033175 [Asimina triloba]